MKKPHPCSDCGRTFSTARYLTKHKRIHSGIKPFCCPHCDKRYTRSDQLKVHIMTFSAEETLREHMQLHKGEKPFHCLQCEKRYSTSDELKEHMMSHTEEKPNFPLVSENRSSHTTALTVGLTLIRWKPLDTRSLLNCLI
uniref:C2H2-type domain-containing protein n=1 Tax=Hucho hucho TaxID=62062 RepID=A0A4W5R4B8_9TELE